MKWFALLSLLSAGCAPALYIPSVENTAASADLVRLKEGRRLYVSHCGNCHTLHLPDEHTAEFWANKLEEMQFKAKISDDERQLIYQFLVNQPVQK